MARTAAAPSAPRNSIPNPPYPTSPTTQAMRTIAAPNETFRSFLLNLAQIADTVGASLRSRKPTAAPAAVPRHRVRVATSPCEAHEQEAGHRYSRAMTTPRDWDA